MDLREQIDVATREQLGIARDPGEVELPEFGTIRIWVESKDKGGYWTTRVVKVRHGIERAYNQYRCRCKRCRAAHAAGRQKRFQAARSRLTS